MPRRALAGLIAGCFAAALSGAVQAETTLEKAKRDGFIRVGFANEAPYGFATPDGRRLRGGGTIRQVRKPVKFSYLDRFKPVSSALAATLLTCPCEAPYKTRECRCSRRRKGNSPMKSCASPR